MPSIETDLPAMLPALRALSRADKLRAIQQLAADLAQEEVLPLMENGAEYPVWTPLQADSAAATLLAALQTEGNTP